MISGFYASAQGMMSHQTFLNTIGNNIANVNTVGYKPQTTGFSALLYRNLNNEDNGSLSIGSGSKVEKTGLVINQGALQKTDAPYDCAIDGTGFFALKNPETNEITYTRDGSFKMLLSEDKGYLVNSSGNYVLDANQNPIDISNGFDPKEIGAVDFVNPYGLKLMGNNQYSETEKSGLAKVDSGIKIRAGWLESSATDISKEMVKMIEASKGFSFNSKLIQTADEMEKIVNQLR
jgi:flagellar basal body rod protein FlgG